VTASLSAANVVEVRGVRYSAGPRVIFDGLDLAVARGSITAVMGPSGTGKTTLLRLLTGQVRPEAGSVEVLGQQVPQLRGASLYALRRRMGMLFQNGALLTDLDVFENVAFPVRENARIPEPVLRRLVLMKLEAVGLRGAAGLMPQQLSGGMARRVALARAIVMDPEVLIYDEPFAGLDPVSMGIILRLIRRLNDALGITSIVVSHDVQEVLGIADCSFLLSGGRAVASGDSRQLQSSADPTVRQFIDGSADGPMPFHYPAGDYREDLLGAVAR
jgi:phospholipid/cholesterol/gamma-HCH transport system ATP-binding protein